MTTFTLNHNTKLIRHLLLSILCKMWSILFYEAQESNAYNKESYK